MGRRLLRKFRQASAVVFITVMLSIGGLLILGRSQGYSVLSVQTGSMRPTIRPGDAVVVRSSQQFRVGQIVSYRSIDNSKLIISHRIVAIDKAHGTLTTKGDALETADIPMSPSRIIGVVNRAVPLAGYSLDVVRQPVGLALAVYIPAISIIVAELRRLQYHYARQHYRLTAYFW